MKSTYNLINIGYNPWSRFWKRNQTIVYLLSKTGFFDKVFFVNPPVWIGELLRNPKKEFTQPHINKWKYTFSARSFDNINIFTPINLPFRSKMKLIDRTDRYFKAGALRDITKTPFLLIVNNVSATATELCEELLKNARSTVFDWSDDFIEFSSDPEERRIIKERCRRLCLNSDLILTVNDRLSIRAREYNSNVYTVRNATNYFTFADDHAEPAALRYIKALGRPTIGYAGWLNSTRLDNGLIYFLADQRPDWQFVFMGPKSDRYPLGPEIPKIKNLHVLGPVAYQEYCSCLSAFDVLILPNRINPHTEGNDPIKIYDYLASGKPVVATKTAGVETFLDYLWVAENNEDFLDKIGLALSESSVRRSDRIDVARRHSWQERIKEILPVLEPLVGRR